MVYTFILYFSQGWLRKCGKEMTVSSAVSWRSPTAGSEASADPENIAA